MNGVLKYWQASFFGPMFILKLRRQLNSLLPIGNGNLCVSEANVLSSPIN